MHCTHWTSVWWRQILCGIRFWSQQVILKSHMGKLTLKVAFGKSCTGDRPHKCWPCLLALERLLFLGWGPDVLVVCLWGPVVPRGTRKKKLLDTWRGHVCLHSGSVAGDVWHLLRHKTSHFTVNNPVVVSTFSVLQPPLRSRSRTLTLPQRRPHTHQQPLFILSSLSPWPPSVCFLSHLLFLTFPIKYIQWTHNILCGEKGLLSLSMSSSFVCVVADISPSRLFMAD